MIDKEDIYTFIVFIIILAAVFCIIAPSEEEEREVRDRWLEESHTCPKCNWTGYYKKMIIDEYGFGGRSYYCPSCGYRLASLDL